MVESGSFSESVDRMLLCLQPHGGNETFYPHGLSRVDARRNYREPLQSWFQRMIEEACGGVTYPARLEENLAVFARIGWSRRQLVYANIQSIWTPCSLDDYCLADEPPMAGYLRLDFDYNSLGEPFSHPLVHIHTDGEDSPRFALDGGQSGNIVVDYLEFLYRNFYPQKWWEWVRQTWERDESNQPLDPLTNPLPRIIDAFKSGQFQVLRNLALDFDRLKMILRRRKDALFEYHMDGQERVVLEYPLAR